MWPFTSNTTLRKADVLRGATDWHCHILPGVDDGVQHMKHSLEILADYEKLGVRRVWLTPHIMEDIPNSTQALRDRYDELCDAYHGSIELKLAAENMLDSLFEERLATDDLLPIGDEGRHLLVETSYYTPPFDLEGILERVMKAGYYPILAHVERYQYMDMEQYDRLRDMGVLMQLNYTSLAGLYGPVPRKKALQLLAKGYYSACGTDLHRRRTLPHAIDEKIPSSAIRRLPAGIDNAGL